MFGRQASAVEAYGKTADTRLGLSAAAYNQYAALVGTALQSAGMSVKESVGETDKIMTRGADLAATFGGTTAEAVDAINAAVSRSEFDPLEKYGIALNMTAVNAELAARGQDDLTGKQAEAAKKAIILEQIYGKSAKAAGQFARESDTAAGSQAIAAAQWENAAAALGEVLLPMATKAATVLAALGASVQKHPGAFQVAAAAVAAFSVVILALNAAIKTATIVQTVWNAVTRLGAKYALMTRIQLAALAVWQKVVTAGQWLWNAAMSANPIGLVVAAVILLVAAIVILWKKSETFRRVVLTVWNATKAGALAAARAISAAFGALWGRLKSAAAAVGRFVVQVWNTIRGAVARVVGSIRSLWQSLMSRLRSVAQAMSGAVSKAWQAIRNAVGFVVSKVGDLIGRIRSVKVPDAIRNAFERVKSAVGYLIGKIADLIGKMRGISLPGSIEAAFNRVKSSAEAVVRAVQNIASWIRNLPTPSINWPSPPSWLNKVTGRSVAPPVRPGFGGPRVSSLAPGVPMATSSTGGAVVINVTGAVDPENVARQINRILSGHSRRVGLAT